MNDCCVEGSVDASIGLDGAHAGRSARRRPFTMTRTRGAIGVATAVLLLVATGSCSDNGSEPPTTRSTQPTTSSTPTPGTTPASDTQAASVAATTLLRNFYTVRNALRQDPTASLDLLKTVATSTELAAQKNLFKNERKQGLHQTGETKVAELEVQSVNLDNSDPKGGKVPTVQIDVCFDVSAVDVLDESGKSVVSEDRPDTGWIRYSVANYDWASNPADAWRVASSQDLEQAPCDAS